MSDTKACPMCGEEVLAVAVKCKHCGSAIDGTREAVSSQLQVRSPVLKVAGVVVLLGVIAAGIYNFSNTGSLSGNGFSDSDVRKIEQDIQAEYAKVAGAKVEQVEMLKESPRKLTGFAKVKFPVVGVLSKSCTATMDDDRRIIWRCN